MNGRKPRRFCILIFSRGFWLRTGPGSSISCGCGQRWRDTMVCFRRRGRIARAPWPRRRAVRLPGLPRAFTRPRSGTRRRRECFIPCWESGGRSLRPSERRWGGGRGDWGNSDDAPVAVSAGAARWVAVRRARLDGPLRADSQEEILRAGAGAGIAGSAGHQHPCAGGAAFGGSVFATSDRLGSGFGGRGGEDAVGLSSVCRGGCREPRVEDDSVDGSAQRDECVRIGPVYGDTSLCDGGGSAVRNLEEPVDRDAGAGLVYFRVDVVVGVFLEPGGGGAAAQRDTGSGVTRPAKTARRGTEAKSIPARLGMANEYHLREQVYS